MQSLNANGVSGVLDTAEEKISEVEDRSAITIYIKYRDLKTTL